MSRSTSKLRTVWCAAALSVAMAAPAAADTWYEHYARAEKALVEQSWSLAIEELNQALEKKGDSDARARTYGMRVAAYFPYLKLGIAYYHLGQLDAALQALETEERLGAVSGSQEHLRELETTRGLVQQARTRSLEEERQAIARVVSESLDEARRLEAAGQLQDAVVALGRALAVDPDNADANSRLVRLRQQIAEREEEAERRRRQTDLVAAGRRALEAGGHGEAASLLRQALALGPDATARRLLLRAQEELRNELEPVRAAERERLVQEALAEARSLETAGRYERALERLEPALTLDPDHREAVALQGRLLEAKTESVRSATRLETIDALTGEARAGLESGRLEDAIAAANRVLSLDPGHGGALEALAAAYRQLNRSLLRKAPRRNLPPAIRFADLRRDLESGLLAERVTTPDYRLNGVIIDESPVQVAIAGASAGRSGEAIVGEQAVGEVVLTEFALDTRLRPGLSTFRLTATDAERLSSSSDYAVLYVRPFFRSPWFFAVAAGAGLAIAGMFAWRRSRRRRRLVTRRFNPYLAGAPVLDEDLFFGRQELLDRILETIHNNSLLLYGERRIGKTSIQHQLRRRLRELEDPDYEFFPVYIDLQGVREDAFFRCLAEEIYEELAPHLDGFTPSAYDEGADSYRLFVRDLHAVLRALERSSAKRPKLVLLIDEVDELNDYDPRINQRLRSLFMKSFAAGMVAVVSGVEIRKRWEREASPWYNFFEEVEVEPLGRDEARALVERPVQGLFKLDPEAVERVLELTACRPYLIQKLCMAVVNRMHRQGRRRITAEDVEAAGRAATEAS